MQPSEVFRLLTCGIRRGLIMFSILWLVSIGCTGSALLVSSLHPWAVAGFLAAILLGLAWIHVRGRYLAAWKVSENPQLVYWAHSRELPRRVARYGMRDYKVLMLHLRDGHQYEFNLSPDDLHKFTNWLSERNPSVRWGAYDKPDSATKAAEL